MPVTYPSDNQPMFTLSGFWLNKQQLSKLCTKLDLIWKEYNGMAGKQTNYLKINFFDLI